MRLYLNPSVSDFVERVREALGLLQEVFMRHRSLPEASPWGFREASVSKLIQRLSQVRKSWNSSSLGFRKKPYYSLPKWWWGGDWKLQNDKDSTNEPKPFKNLADSTTPARAEIYKKLEFIALLDPAKTLTIPYPNGGGAETEHYEINRNPQLSPNPLKTLQISLLQRSPESVQSLNL